jgi:pyruvate dehydrogenase E2 component (dihydrolipoamide acetyltransferase)
MAGAAAGELVMPRLSDTMEEGTILRWLKADGEHVSRGEELVEIETDKATMTYESDLEGELRIIAAEGSTLAVGEVIAQVGAAQTTDTPAVDDAQPEPTLPERTPTDNGSAAATAPTSPARPSSAAGETGRLRVSPLARRLASESGVDLRTVTGSGPSGRIVKADVLASAGAASPSTAVTDAGPGAPPAPAPTATLEGVATAKGQTTTVELTRTQQTIARRMAESKATIPDFSLQVEVDMEDCVQLRSELKRLTQSPGSEPAAVPTYNDMIVKACALALREHPHANGSYRDGKLQLHSRVNVGVAVAAEGALVVPTVFDADAKALGEIARETRALAERVRAGTITPPELGGGTFTVSNLGMFGVRSFAAIINPPQAAIMSVGSLEQRPVARDGGLLVRHTLTLTLVCDHRILYGAEAAHFAARVRELLQAPSALTL